MIKKYNVILNSNLINYIISILGIYLIKYSQPIGIIFLTIGYYQIVINNSKFKSVSYSFSIGLLYFTILYYWGNLGWHLVIMGSLLTGLVYANTTFATKVLLDYFNKNKKYNKKLKIITLPTFFLIFKFIFFNLFFGNMKTLLEAPAFFVYLYGIIPVSIIYYLIMIFSIYFLINIKSHNNKSTFKIIFISIFLILILTNISYSSIIKHDYGDKVLSNIEIKIASIQGNFNQNLSWRINNKEIIFDYYKSQILNLSVNEKPDIIILPENVIIQPNENNKTILNKFRNLSNITNTIIIYGETNSINNLKNNVAYFILQNGSYYEHLSQNPFEGLKGINSYKKGNQTTIFKTPIGNFAILICFEAIFRNNINSIENIQDIDALFVISNNHFISKKEEFDIIIWNLQEIASSKRLNIITSTNTGPTLQINKYGSIINITKTNNENILISKIIIIK